MQDVYKNIEDYNPGKERKILIVFDNMFVDLISRKKLNPIVTKLFSRGRKLNSSLVFIMQPYFKVPTAKDIGLNPMHFFIMKVPNKKEFQQIATNHLIDINLKDSIKTYKNKQQNHILFI